MSAMKWNFVHATLETIHGHISFFLKIVIGFTFMVHKMYKICCVCALGQQTCKKNLFQTEFYASHKGYLNILFSPSSRPSSSRGVGGCG